MAALEAERGVQMDEQVEIRLIVAVCVGFVVMRG